MNKSREYGMPIINIGEHDAYGEVHGDNVTYAILYGIHHYIIRLRVKFLFTQNLTTELTEYQERNEQKFQCQIGTIKLSCVIQGTGFLFGAIQGISQTFAGENCFQLFWLFVVQIRTCKYQVYCFFPIELLAIYEFVFCN